MESHHVVDPRGANLPEARQFFMLHPIDFTRIQLLDRGADQILIMDRISGRWAYLPASEKPFLELLGSPEPLLRRCSPDVADRVLTLQSWLHQLRIGVNSIDRQFGDLNTIILKMTNACNMACAYCYDFEAIEKATRLEFDLALNAIKQGLALAKGPLTIILHGGEPMLVWPLIEKIVLEGKAIAATQKKELRFTGQTNMTRLSQRIVDFSVEHDITWGVSLDGTQSVHDRFRTHHDGTGTFAIFLKALHAWPEFVRRSSVMTTVTAANQSLLLETARYFRDLGMAGWDWSLFQPIGRGRNFNPFILNLEQLSASWDELFDAVIEGEFDGFPIQPVKKYVDNFFHGPAGNMCLRPKCGAARDLLSISANGTIEACDCIDPRGPLSNLGDIRSSTLSEARSSPVAEKIRSRDMSNHPLCGTCIWYGVCGGTCLAHAPGLNDIWREACGIALLAFDRISEALAGSNTLQRYIQSLEGEPLPHAPIPAQKIN